MTKPQLEANIKALVERDGLDSVRWGYAYTRAQDEQESNSAKDSAYTVLNGRPPTPCTIEGLAEWLWDEKFDIAIFDGALDEQKIVWTDWVNYYNTHLRTDKSAV